MRTATVGSSVAATSHLVDKGPVGWGGGAEVRQENCRDGKRNLNVGVSPVLVYVEALENYTYDSQDGCG